MEFKLSLDWGKKKSTPIEKSHQNNNPYEFIGNNIFYPLIKSEQNNQALILMINDIPEVSAPVNYILDSMTVIPYHHYRNGEVIENSPYIQALSNPNQYQVDNDFIKMYFLNLVGLGMGYVNTVKAVGIDKYQLYILPTQNTSVNLKDTNSKDIRTNQIISYTTDFGYGELTLSKEEVEYQLEVGLIQDNYFIGRSRLMSAILTSDSLRYNYETRIAQLKDRGAVGIISPRDVNSTISSTEAKQMREKYYDENGVTGDKNPFLISPRSLDFTPTTFNADELKLIENKDKDMERVCNVLQLDPSLFGLGNNTFNNKKLAKTSFWEDTATMYFDSYMQFLTKKVFKLPNNEEIKADYSDIPSLQADLEKLTNSNSKAYQDGVIWQSEYRASIGKDGGEDKYKTEIE